MRAKPTFRRGDRVRLCGDAMRRSYPGDCAGPGEVVKALGPDVVVVKFDRSGDTGMFLSGDVRRAR